MRELLQHINKGTCNIGSDVIRKRAVLIWNDIGNYHHCRSAAASRFSSLDLHIFEVTSKSTYAEFASGVPSDKGYPVIQLGFDRLLNAAERKKRMHEAFLSTGPDVVFVPGWASAASYLAIEWCVQNQVACVLMSESTEDDKERSPYKEAIKRRIVALAQAGFAGGRKHIGYLIKLGMPEKHIVTGYDVVDNDHFWIGAQPARNNSLQYRERLGLPKCYFLCCCRIHRTKKPQPVD